MLNVTVFNILYFINGECFEWGSGRQDKYVIV